MLEGVLADGAHHRLVDLVCDKAYDWVTENHTTVLRIVEQRAPTWSPRFVDGIIADRVYLEVQNFAWAVKTDPEHPLRKAIDTFLVEFAGDLQRDRETIERVERIKYQIVEHPEVQRFIGQAWRTVKKLVLDAAADPRRRCGCGCATGCWRSARGCPRTPSSRQDRRLAGGRGGLPRAALPPGDHQLITDTVARWDADETSRKIELQVGRDLQFIRINGTVVGALAGLAIYTVSQLFFGGM